MKRTDEPPGQLSPKVRARCQLLRQILQLQKLRVSGSEEAPPSGRRGTKERHLPSWVPVGASGSRNPQPAPHAHGRTGPGMDVLRAPQGVRNLSFHQTPPNIRTYWRAHPHRLAPRQQGTTRGFRRFARRWLEEPRRGAPRSVRPAERLLRRACP
eukprot:scaffold4349_cov258-Pinguiococcus_pyrenoidosus.AAC.8